MSDKELVEHLLQAIVAAEANPIELKRYLAEGGAGAVALTKDNVLGRHLATKVLHDQCLAEPLLVRGFLREAQVTAQLSHPNIVGVHELGVRNGKPFFTMDLVDGKSLEAWLGEVALVDYDRAMDFLDIMCRVCDALEFAHCKGVIHCDLKPANIMVGEFGQVYLMDWGGAEFITPTASSGEGAPDDEREPVRDTLPELPKAGTAGKVFGTLSYMAPERIRGEAPDAGSDVFSLGGILYEFIVGHPPFKTGDPLTMARQIAACEIEPLNEGAHGDILPRQLYRIVEQALAAKREDRHASAAALRADLRQVMRGGSSHPVVEYKAGDLVMREGDEGREAFIVIVGELEVFRFIDGQRTVLRKMGRGEVFGEMAIFMGGLRTASVAATSDTKLVCLAAEAIKSELDTMKPWMAAFVRTLAERFHERETEHLRAELKGDTEAWWSRK